MREKIDIREGNLLIAEFMGCKRQKRYDKYWHNLITVIARIKTVDLNENGFFISTAHRCNLDAKTFYITKVTESNVFNAIVKYLRWNKRNKYQFPTPESKPIKKAVQKIK